MYDNINTVPIYRLCTDTNKFENHSIYECTDYSKKLNERILTSNNHSQSDFKTLEVSKMYDYFSFSLQGDQITHSVKKLKTPLKSGMICNINIPVQIIPSLPLANNMLKAGI